MTELFYIIDLSDGEVMQTTDKAVAMQYRDSYVVINASTGVYRIGDNDEEHGIHNA